MTKERTVKILNDSKNKLLQAIESIGRMSPFESGQGVPASNAQISIQMAIREIDKAIEINS